MDINTLKTFVAVCEYGSFTQAAEKLGYTQPTVSAQIKQLEKELDTVLFDRIRHNTTLTSKGNTILSYAKSILQTHQQMIDSIHHLEEITGEIRLAMADSVCYRFFTDDFYRFQGLYPEINVKITSAGTEQMFDMLKKNEADILFTLDSHIYDQEYIICGESTEQVHFVAASGHRLVDKKDISIDDILDERFYLTQPGMSYRRTMDSMLAERSLSITPALETGNPDQICRLLQNGNAISLLPDYVTDVYTRNGSLKYLDVRDFNIEVWTQILIHKSKWISPAMKVFIDFYSSIIAQ